MTVAPKPSFATNRPGDPEGADGDDEGDAVRVADALNAYLGYARSSFHREYGVAIATAYFNPAGFELIADELEHVGHVRLLLGAEPDRPDRRRRPLADAATPAGAERARWKQVFDTHRRHLDIDRDLIGFTHIADRSARRLVDWLRSGQVEVRRFEAGFLHGKAFIVSTTITPDGVIAGSSNFTYAGLATNIELNLGNYDPHVVGEVVDWFDGLWEKAEPFDLAAVYGDRFDPHSPYLIYLRMLWELYGAELLAEADAGEAGIQLTKLQRHGLWRAQRILDDHRGVVVADEVGLGKTFIAGELIRQAVAERRQRVLVVAPATLRDGMWKKFLVTRQLGVELVSYDDVAADRRLNPDCNHFKLQFDPDEYAMVVVDEAHNLRNPSTQRAIALRRLLAGKPPKDVVLLTATPVNNSLWDLYHLLTFFVGNDAAFADVGILSLRDHFVQAMAMNPDDLSAEHLFDVLDAVAVRRTRSFVKEHYPNDKVPVDGVDRPIVFPTPRVHKVSYDLDAVLPGFFDRFAAALDPSTPQTTIAPPAGADGRGDGRDKSDETTGDAFGDAFGEVFDDGRSLSLARYVPSRYRLGGDAVAHETQIAGLLRSGLLKRFESSAAAFAATCRTMIASHDGFLTLVDTGRVATGATLADWIATDSDDADAVSAFGADHTGDVDDAADFDVDRLRHDVEADRDLLEGFALVAEAVTSDADPKLAAVVDALADISAAASRTGVGEGDTANKRKVLIFSYFADTVDWIFAHLVAVAAVDDRLAAYRDRIVAVTGSSGSKQDVLWGFAPSSTDAPAHTVDRYDIVVATDVLAEGVNLQQAGHIINYDLPWNPMRLVQRHGRIDRINSVHREVHLRCVFPDARLDELLGLERRLHTKIAQAANVVGVTEVLPGTESRDVNFAETRDEIERLHAEDASLFERGGTTKSVLSGEEYRQELRRALQDPDLKDRIEALPWGSGSGMIAHRSAVDGGFVFCIRVGDSDRPLYRYVAIDDSNTPRVVADTLSCLDLAYPAERIDTPRTLDDDTYTGAFDAWEHARASVLDDWNAASDPANVAPKVPAAMRRAVELVRAHQPPSMTLADADRLVDILETPRIPRVVNAIKAAMRDDVTNTEKVERIAAVADDWGLEPDRSPPAPWPEITADDVHLVCWIAISAPS